MVPSEGTDADVAVDHLYICTYGGARTVSTGDRLVGWNEGLPEPLTVERDLGAIEHAWVVTDGYGQPERKDHVTDAGFLVCVPRGASQHETTIESGVAAEVQLPETVFPASVIGAAARGADPTDCDQDTLDRLDREAKSIADEVNASVGSAVRERYEEWRAGASPYPEGRDFVYEVPLPAAWRREVLGRAGLSEAEAAVVADVGAPAMMRIRIAISREE